MAATAHTKVFWPAGSICCSDQPPASNDVESCSAPLRGLAIRCQKRAVLFPRRHGLPTCENCAWGGRRASAARSVRVPRAAHSVSVKAVHCLSASGAEPTSVSAHGVSSVPALARPARPHPARRFVTPCQPTTRASPATACSSSRFTSECPMQSDSAGDEFMQSRECRRATRIPIVQPSA